MSTSKKSRSQKQQIDVKVWSGFNDAGDPVARDVKAWSGPTVADVAAAVLRAMKITKAQENDVKFSTHMSTAPASGDSTRLKCVTSIYAVLRNNEGRQIRRAMTAPIDSLEGARIESTSLFVFLSYFTDRNVFTSTRDQVVFHYASRTAKEKREAGLVAAFNRLPARQQAALLKALRVGPAIVVQAGVAVEKRVRS